ncbi:MAG TPA: hypothetical protein VHC19_25425 [Pirellulales bacterium]|nr:hypothetical protein [Pirellulales bacterium]
MHRHALSWFALLLACGAAANAAAPERAADRSAPNAASAYRTARLSRQYVSQMPGTISSSEAQALVNAPIARNYFLPYNDLPRNYGPTDVGGRGTGVGLGISQVPDELPTVRTVYGGYDRYFGVPGGALQGLAYSAGFAPTLGSPTWGGGPMGSPVGIRSGVYHPRYFAPYWYSPLRAGLSVYNPYFFYNNSYYGGYSSPFYMGFGGFGFPNSFGAYRAFGYPYSYGVYGYPYYNYLRGSYAYMPSYAYFMYPGLGALYVPPGFYGFPGYYGYGGYGMPLGNFGYGGSFYW